MKKLIFPLCVCLLPSMSAGQEVLTQKDVSIMHDAGVKVAFPGERTVQVLPADAQPGELLKVEMLDLANASLHRIPPWLRRFTNLRKLDLSKNQLDADSDLLETLQAMPKLDVLNLSGNPLFAGETAAQSLAPVWQRLSELAELYLSETQGAAKNYGSLAPLTSLKALDLSGNQIANEVGVLELNKLSSLEELNLSKNGMSTFPGTDIPAKGLRLLDLSFNELAEIPYVEMNELRIWQLRGQKNSPVRLADDYGDLLALKELKKLQCDQPSSLPEGLKKRLERMAQDRLREQRSSACADFGFDSCDNGVMTDPVSGMQFVYVPGGCFDMGSEENDDEKPVHEVCVNAFWMGKYEVTQGQWRNVMGGNPAKFQKGDDYPVEQVSWEEAQGFITKLTSMTGKKFSLPAEAEWEYACRAGGSGKYCGGDDADHVAWHEGNSGGSTHPVGGKEKNFFGLHDMSGNVWEWCSDRYGKDYYASSPKDNPTGPESGSDRVIRGGSWYDTPKDVRSANRVGSTPDNRYNGLGFRLLLSGQQGQAGR